MFSIPYSITFFFQDVDIFIQYPAVVVNILIILISIKKVPPSLPRTYSLNISIPSLICAVYSIARDLTSTTVLRDWELNEVKYQEYRMITIVFDALFYHSTLNLYLCQATLTIFLAYIGFARPMLFQRLVGSSAFFYAFLTFQVLSWLLAAESALGQIQLYKFHYSRTILAVHTWLRIVIQIVLCAIMAILFVLTLFKLTVYAYCQQSQNVNQISRWKVLRSVLIHCTPPNVFIIVGIAGSYCDGVRLQLTRGMIDVSPCASIYDLAEHMIMLRLLITSLSVLFAFADYRNAVIAGVQAFLSETEHRSVIEFMTICIDCSRCLFSHVQQQ